MLLKEIEERDLLELIYLHMLNIQKVYSET